VTSAEIERIRREAPGHGTCAQLDAGILAEDGTVPGETMGLYQLRGF
jgi:hypothetical protein